MYFSKVSLIWVLSVLYSCQNKDTSKHIKVENSSLRYKIVPYLLGYGIDTIPAFSYIALGSSRNYPVRTKTRIAYLNYTFKWNVGNELDSAFVFGIFDSLYNPKINDNYDRGVVNFEIWYRISSDSLSKITDSLKALFDGHPIYYKPPTDWHWFVYKDKFFFFDCYLLGNRRCTPYLRDKYMKDTLFLDYVLNQFHNKRNIHKNQPQPAPQEY